MVHVCEPPSVSRVYLSHYSSVSTLLYPKIIELFLLYDFRKVYEQSEISLGNGSVGNVSVGNGWTNGWMASEDPHQPGF